jgi:predicted secreted Zn-dependent protease
MRLAAWILAGALGVLTAGGAVAGVKVSVETNTYSISGRTGEELIRSMDRRGPRHGFTARAIAQTRYVVGWEFEWAMQGRTCRLRDATGTLDVTYSYPKLTGVATRDLKRRWDRFLVGVYAHEEMHGRIARDMVRAADKSLKGLSARNDPNCRRAATEAKRRVEKVYAIYEAKQAEFDRREHKDGGNVENMLRGLAGLKRRQ